MVEKVIKIIFFVEERHRPNREKDIGSFNQWGL
jgi:hypothetical protein